MKIKKIKITRVSTIEYDAKDQDLAYYEDQGILNNDQIALHDMQELENETVSMEDIDGTLDHEYKVVLVDDDLFIHEVDERNTERDLELFPIEESDKTGEAEEDANAHLDSGVTQ